MLDCETIPKTDLKDKPALRNATDLRVFIQSLYLYMREQSDSDTVRMPVRQILA